MRPTYATRREAYGRIRPHEDSMKGRITAWLKANPRSTVDNIEAALGLKHQTASARVSELFGSGRIIADGEAPTRSGRMAVLWVVSTDDFSPTPKKLSGKRRIAELEAQLAQALSELKQFRRVLVPISGQLDLLVDAKLAEVGQ